MAKSSIVTFRRRVWAYYKKHGRHDLPWRQTRDPYEILVSEVMLQQTQVKRALSFYTEFTKRFPTATHLAKAPLSAVLKVWQGLGYNRRAKLLHEATRVVVEKYGGTFPKIAKELELLPGIGSYSARAVAAFAFNTPDVIVETNIRTAVTHHFFKHKKKISDGEIEKVLARALPKGRAREWYWALMDYGAHLKQSGVRLNSKSKHYTTQPQFRGSLREARGAILKELAKGAQKEPRLLGLLGDDRIPQSKVALAALQKEGFIQKRGRVYTLPD
jgi:A/G-specific adenine glycosylase